MPKISFTALDSFNLSGVGTFHAREFYPDIELSGRVAQQLQDKKLIAKGKVKVKTVSGAPENKMLNADALENKDIDDVDNDSDPDSENNPDADGVDNVGPEDGNPVEETEVNPEAEETAPAQKENKGKNKGKKRKGGKA